MQRLILLRHAKAAAHAGGGDSERPLTGRGHKDATRVGLYLRAQSLLPDMAIVSHARRTRETLDRVLEATGDGIPINVEPRLYHADPLILISSIRDVPARTHLLLVVGHNPGLGDLARELVGFGDRYARKRLDDGFPTSSLAVIDFDGDGWTGVDIGKGRLDRFITPEDLPAED